jgi:hypothetical protein
MAKHMDGEGPTNLLDPSRSYVSWSRVRCAASLAVLILFYLYLLLGPILGIACWECP